LLQRLQPEPVRQQLEQQLLEQLQLLELEQQL
jgi:hypothetical protein